MKTLVLVVALTAGFAVQSEPSVAGSWTAQFGGRTFLRLDLKSVNGTLSGGMTIGNIEVDTHGALRRVEEPPRDLSPIFDLTQHVSTVTFSRKDGDDTDRFELRVLDAGHAELRFLLSDDDRAALAASGSPLPKPISLTR